MPSKRTYAVHIVKKVEGFTLPSTVFIRSASAKRAREIVERLPSTVQVDSIDVEPNVKGAIEG